MFLADAVAAYVDSLSEREFDGPFMALLRLRGYRDVHLTHGPAEAGKDFIARKTVDGVETQFCFQSKAGNMGVTGWREVQRQVHAMRTGRVVHPSFDPDLPRRLIVVTTGRLTGMAGQEFQADNEYYVSRNELPAQLWDRDQLVPELEDVIVETPSAVERARALEMLGRLGRGSCDRSMVAEFASGWSDERDRGERWRNLLVGAFVAVEARRAGREDLALQLGFWLIRGAWEAADLDEAQREQELRTCYLIVRSVFEAVWEKMRSVEPLSLTTKSGSGLDAFVTHPLQSCRLAEFIALYGLFVRCSDNDETLSAALTEHLKSLVSETPAVAHPISDEWSYSILIVAVFLRIRGEDGAWEKLLRGLAVWLLDKIEYGSGVAPVGATPRDEIRQLLGPPYRRIEIPRLNNAYGLAVVADLAHVFGYEGLYIDLVHDLNAVDAAASIVCRRESGTVLVARISYDVSGDHPADHHLQPLDEMAPARHRRWFDCFATWATQRDRHIPAVVRQAVSGDS